MQTPLIFTQTDALSGAASVPSKSAPNDASGPSFNDFLSQGLANQSSNTQPAPAPSQSASNNNGNNNSVNRSNNVNNDANSKKTDNTTDNKAPEQTASNAPAAKTDAKQGDVKDSGNTQGKGKSDDDSNSDAQAATAAASNQLLALVADVGKLAAGKVQTDEAGKSDAAVGAIAAGVKQLGDQLQAATDVGLKGGADLAAALQGDAKKVAGAADLKDLASSKLTADAGAAKPGDFAAAVRDAAQDKGKEIAQDLRNASASGADVSSAGADRKLEPPQALAADATATTDSLQKTVEAVQTPAPQAFVQQLAATAAQLNPAAASDHIGPRVGSNGWDQAVGQKVVWMVAGGKQTAELTLNPPDLGPMKVVLSVHNDQASASFTAAQPEVREALEAAMPKLRQMMSDAGVQLAGFSVGTQSPNQQNQQQFASGNNSSGSGNFADTAADVGLAMTPSAAPARASVQVGMVDTFA